MAKSTFERVKALSERLGLQPLETPPPGSMAERYENALKGTDISFDTGGMTKLEAQKSLLKPLFRHLSSTGQPMGNVIRKDLGSLATALKFLKFLPEEELAGLNKLEVLSAFSQPKRSGQYFPKHWTSVGSEPEILIKPGGRPSAESLGHELGHHKTFEEARKIAERLGMGPEEYRKAAINSYTSNPTSWESLAEDIGAILRKPSGIGSYQPIRKATISNSLEGRSYEFGGPFSLSQVPTGKIFKDLVEHLSSLERYFSHIMGK